MSGHGPLLGRRPLIGRRQVGGLAVGAVAASLLPGMLPPASAADA